MSGRWSSGGKAVSLALFFKKFGGEWSYKNLWFLFRFVLEPEHVAMVNHPREKGGAGNRAGSSWRES